MTTIISATENNINNIRALAAIAWPHAFKDILSPAQIEYMMNWMYNPQSLLEQMREKKHRYVLVKEDDDFVGYLSYELNCENTGKTKIHKIYILPSRKKMGFGKLLLNFAAKEALENGDSAIYLNVNKYNENAIGFYTNNGFFLAKEEVIDIGDGFVMDDFVFEKTLNASCKSE